jgi:mRNA deadenylase 3'-5' endonuclease subunit Ccr4
VKDAKLCSAKVRYDGLQRKLEDEIAKNSIVCLQEVSLNWCGKLFAFFANNNYTMLVSNYGNRFSGFMGVAIAFPTNKYLLIESDITCIADSKAGGYAGNSDNRRGKNVANSKEQETSLISTISSSLVLFKTNTIDLAFSLYQFWASTITRFMFFSKSSTKNEFSKTVTVDNPWETSRWKTNTMITLRLRPKINENESNDFLVATYHMPCVFYSPPEMTIHTTLCIQKLQAISQGKYPYILAGDFNIKPNSAQYAFITTGILPPVCSDPTDEQINGKSSLPDKKAYEGDSFEFALPRGPMKSAYCEYFKHEPELTNFAKTVDNKTVFSATLDYIFYNHGEKYQGKTSKLQVVNCKSLDEIIQDIKTQQLESLPSKTEPSDHLLLAAEFDLYNE